jgi:uncharacterized protein with PIN domain
MNKTIAITIVLAFIMTCPIWLAPLCYLIEARREKRAAKLRAENEKLRQQIRELAKDLASQPSFYLCPECQAKMPKHGPMS